MFYSSFHKRNIRCDKNSPQWWHRCVCNRLLHQKFRTSNNQSEKPAWSLYRYKFITSVEYFRLKFDVKFFDVKRHMFTHQPISPGLRTRAVIHNTRYSRVCLMDPWCHRWTCLQLIEFTQKVRSLSWVCKVNQNFLTTLQSVYKHCKAVPGYFNLWMLLFLWNNMQKIIGLKTVCLH